MRGIFDDLRCSLDSVQLFHRHVDDGDIRLMLPGGVYRFDSGAGFRHHVELGAVFQNVTQALAHQCMVIRKKNPNRHQAVTSSRTAGVARGIRSAIPVPLPGAESITRDPPAIAARSRMPNSPKPAVL